MAVMAVDAPRLEHAVGVAVLAGAADVVHDFVAPVLDDRLADARSDVVERLVPRHACPLSGSAIAVALHREQDPIGIVELIGRHDALGARAAAAAGVQRIAFDLSDRQPLLIDVREDAAGRLAVEADARDDPVLPPLLPRPRRRLVLGVVVPFRRIGVSPELRHDIYDRGTLWPASTQTYSHAKVPASPRTAASGKACITTDPIASSTQMTAPPQKIGANAPRRIAATASSRCRVACRTATCSMPMMIMCSVSAPMSIHSSAAGSGVPIA